MGEDCEPSEGGCCNALTCKFVESGTSCRAAGGDCDLQDFCSGTSATCDDLVKDAGVECAPAKGVCLPAAVCSGDSG